MAKPYLIAIGRTARGDSTTNPVRRAVSGWWSPRRGLYQPVPTLVTAIYHRLLGRPHGRLVATTVYPATGPGPGPDVHAQRLDCPFLGRCGGCWIEEAWPAEAEVDET